jgi:hypothetical protein
VAGGSNDQQQPEHHKITPRLNRPHWAPHAGSGPRGARGNSPSSLTGRPGSNLPSRLQMPTSCYPWSGQPQLRRPATGSLRGPDWSPLTSSSTLRGGLLPGRCGQHCSWGRIEEPVEVSACGGEVDWSAGGLGQQVGFLAQPSLHLQQQPANDQIRVGSRQVRAGERRGRLTTAPTGRLAAAVAAPGRRPGSALGECSSGHAELWWARYSRKASTSARRRASVGTASSTLCPRAVTGRMWSATASLGSAPAWLRI